MKKLFIVITILFSVSSFAQKFYGLDREGETCRLAFWDDIYVTLGECGIMMGEPKLKENKIIYRGSADFLECKIVVTTKDATTPVSAELYTRHVLKPIFTRKLKCNALKREKLCTITNADTGVSGQYPCP